MFYIICFCEGVEAIALQMPPIGSTLSASWRRRIVAHAAVRPPIDPAAAQPPNLSDSSTRQRLTPSAVDGIVRLDESGRLWGPEGGALRGGVSDRSWFRKKKRDWSGTLSQDTL